MKTKEYIKIISESTGQRGKLEFGFNDLSVYFTPQIKNSDFEEIINFLHVNNNMQEVLSLNIEQNHNH